MATDWAGAGCGVVDEQSTMPQSSLHREAASFVIKFSLIVVKFLLDSRVLQKLILAIFASLLGIFSSHALKKIFLLYQIHIQYKVCLFNHF